MAGRHHGRGFIQRRNDEEQGSNSPPFSPTYSPSNSPTYPVWGKRGPRGPRPRNPPPDPWAYGKPKALTRNSGRPYPGSSDAESSCYGDEQEEDDDDNDDDDDDYVDDDYQPGETSDNPLYEFEVEENRPAPKPATTRQGTPSSNPLYANAFPEVDMTQFLQPKRRRRLENPDQPNGRSEYESESSPDRRSPSPPTAPDGRPRESPGLGMGLFGSPPGSFIAMQPPVRLDSSLIPGPRVTGRRSKRIKQSPPAATAAQAPAPRPSPRFDGQRILDLIAAVRSDQNLLIGEVRRDGAIEPRVPGDHDRHFAPRKGDIIVHYSITPENGKVVEYFDEKKTMLHLQTGDKLVRVKYDNYKIPDHLMITSKLYIYAPEWIYLGKAVQTIKTA